MGLVIPAAPITRPATPFTPQSVFGWGGSRNLTRYIFTPRYLGGNTFTETLSGTFWKVL